MISEELYIIKDGEKYKIDLNSPSGITLNFNSNLFNDISKITSSYSYTFSIPKTLKNLKTLELVDDIRIKSSLYSKKCKCEYIVDGYNILNNANLYIENCTKTINCVMTFNVLEGLQNIADNDFELNLFDEKENKETAMIYVDSYYVRQLYDVIPSSYYTADYRNISKYSKPYFVAGVERGYRDGTDHMSPTPVAHVPYLLDRISNHFGVDVRWYNVVTRSSDGFIKDTNKPNRDYIDFGVIPCVKFGLTDKQKDKFAINFKHPVEYQNKGGDYEKPKNKDIYVFWFLDITYDKAEEYLVLENAPMDNKVNKNGANFGFHYYFENYPLGYEVSGKIVAWFENKGIYDDDFSLTLGLYGPKGDLICSVEGNYLESKGTKKVFDVDCAAFEFNMVKAEGGQILSCTSEDVSNVTKNGSSPYNFFAFNKRCYDIDTTGWMKLIPVNDTEFGELNGSVSKKMAANYGAYITMPTDLISNLPSIKCIDFLKSIMFIVGAFPKVEKDNKIGLYFYSDIHDNVIANNAYDWSDCVDYDEATLEFKCSDFAQNNYLMMASDDEEETTNDSDEPKDVYANGKANIKIENSIISKSKTITKLPFYAPFISSKENPLRGTGNTIKLWSHDYGFNFKFSTVEAKPAYGVVRNTESGVFVMDVLNPFETIENSSYSYLQEILKDPKCIKLPAKIPLTTLKNLDYSKPVYIDKYNSYFGIISVEWKSSDGKCDINLIKLPIDYKEEEE